MIARRVGRRQAGSGRSRQAVAAVAKYIKGRQYRVVAACTGLKIGIGYGVEIVGLVAVAASGQFKARSELERMPQGRHGVSDGAAAKHLVADL